MDRRSFSAIHEIAKIAVVICCNEAHPKVALQVGQDELAWLACLEASKALDLIPAGYMDYKYLTTLRHDKDVPV